MMLRALLFCCCLFLSAGAFSQSADSIYVHVDTPAEFPGGSTALLQWLHQNMQCPEMPDDELTGRAYVSFVVETTGKLSNVRVRCDSPTLTRYLGGFVLSMPKWTPAVHNGQTVRSAYNLPIEICLKK